MTTVEEHLHRGIALQSSLDLDGAAAAFLKALEMQPSNAAALYSLAAIRLNQGRHQDALGFGERCVRSNLGSSLGWYIYAAALQAATMPVQALACISKALELDPLHVDSLVLKGGLMTALEQRTEALAAFERALEISPGHQTAVVARSAILGVPKTSNPQADALANRGIALQTNADLSGAQRLFEQALALQSDNFPALYSLAVIALNRGVVADGLKYSERCIASHADSAMSWYIRGCALKQARHFKESIEHFDNALALSPDYKEAFSEKGLACAEIHDYVQALLQFNEVLRIDPVHKLALTNMGMLLTILKKNEDAAQFYARLLALDPDYEYVLGALVHARLHCCDWTDFARNRELILEGVRQSKRICRPLAFLALSDSPAEQLICTRLFMEQSYPPKPVAVWKGEKYTHQRIRIGYVSPDLREHPVGHLMAGVFERHDKSRFEVYSFSLGIDDQSSLRKRFVAASDHFFDVRNESSLAIAELVRKHEIDVLIDLAGPTADSRPDVFGYRAAPVQVGYLGYAGTTAVPYMDYLIADETVVPPGDQVHYPEKLLYLPGCYLPTDPEVRVAERTPTRAEMSLPESGFVFCSFNHDYKINPPVFDVWMKILSRVEGSVLWLMKLNEVAEANLRKEAEARGISGTRLIFAGRVPAISDHLARYRLAGLFLDTSPYNAHSTATDVLRAGLPVLTLEGHSFQSRVATSIVRAIDMPELSVPSLSEYEEFAVRIGNSPAEAEALKARLRGKVETAEEFDPNRKTANLEKLYAEAHSRRR